MTTHKVSAEGVVSSDANNDINSLLVNIWDLGPKAPKIPAKPDLPKGKEGSAEYDLAMIDFRAELSKYESGLAIYAREKREFDDWHRTYEGPYQIEMYSVNAREAIQIDPERYTPELPKGHKPGKWQAAQVQREKDARRTFAQTIARDPVFGSQGARHEYP